MTDKPAPKRRARRAEPAKAVPIPAIYRRANHVALDPAAFKAAPEPERFDARDYLPKRWTAAQKLGLAMGIAVALAALAIWLF